VDIRIFLQCEGRRESRSRRLRRRGSVSAPSVCPYFFPYRKRTLAAPFSSITCLCPLPHVNVSHWSSIADFISPPAVRNFVGCLRSLYVDSVNILERVRRRSTVAAADSQRGVSGSGFEDMRVVYGDVGRALPPRRATFGCHNLALSAFRLTRPGAFIHLPHSAASDSFNFRVSFVTVKPDGVLVFTTVDDRSSPSSRRVMQVGRRLFRSIYIHLYSP